MTLFARFEWLLYQLCHNHSMVMEQNGLTAGACYWYWHKLCLSKFYNTVQITVLNRHKQLIWLSILPFLCCYGYLKHGSLKTRQNETVRIFWDLAILVSLFEMRQDWTSLILFQTTEASKMVRQSNKDRPPLPGLKPVNMPVYNF